MKNPSLKVVQIIELLKTLTLLEIIELIALCETEFGISTASLLNSTVTNGIAHSSPITEDVEISSENIKPVIKEKTEFDIHLISIALDKKIPIIRVVRTITNLTLKEAKDIVDNVPKIIKEGISRVEADQIKSLLEEVGGVVSIK